MDRRILEVRRQKHLDYQRRVWLPQFLDKYKYFLHPKRLSVLKIQQFVRKHFFVAVLNVSDDEIKFIPGIYRMRLKLTNKNKEKYIKENKKEKKKENKKANKNTNAIIIKHQPQIHDEIDKAIEESLKELTINEDDILNKVISDSKKDSDTNFDENSLLELAIMESIKDQISPVDTEQKSNETLSFYVCIDLRVYGPNPFQSVYVNDQQYFLNEQQIKKVEQTWKRINQTKYQQDFEYQKCLATDRTFY